MNILLISMPDSFEHMPTVGIRMPNGALSSLAGNLDPHHRVAVADLILAQGAVTDDRGAPRPRAVPRPRRAVGDDVPAKDGARHHPAHSRASPGSANRCWWLRPEPGSRGLHRAGERGGLHRARGGRADVSRARAVPSSAAAASKDIPGLSYQGRATDSSTTPTARSTAARRARYGGRTATPGSSGATRSSDARWTSWKPRAAAPSTAASVRSSRCVAATSTPTTLERVLDDIRDAREHGARAIFLVDDNITLNVPRFEALCRAIVDAGLDGLTYLVQAMTSSIAATGPRWLPSCAGPGSATSFSASRTSWTTTSDSCVPGRRTRCARTAEADNATITAIEHIRRNGMYVVGGLIVGNPDDTRESIEANLAFARRWVDYPYIQHPTPYPADTDDEGVPRPRAHHQRAAGGV